LRSKSKGVNVPFGNTSQVAARLTVIRPGGQTEVAASISAEELWPGGDVSGEKEVTKACHIQCNASGQYALHFDSEYGLFVIFFAYVGYGSWIGVATDSTPVISKIWQTTTPTTTGIKVSEVYTFNKA
jgi:hypothetical protein